MKKALRVMPHRREEQRDTRLVAPDMGSLAASLDHQHAIAGRIEVLQGGGIGMQLVPEDQHELAHGFRCGEYLDEASTAADNFGFR